MPTLDDLIEELARIGEQVAGRGSHVRILEDLRILAAQLPGVEQERPVDVGNQVGERESREQSSAYERRMGDVLAAPLDLRTLPARLGIREQRTRLALRVKIAQAVLLGLVRRRKV